MPKKTQINAKISKLFILMQKFLYQKEISSYDEAIREEFGCNQKTLERYLLQLENDFSHIITIEKSKPKIWKLVTVSDVFEEFIKNSEDIYMLFEMARDFDPEIFKELESSTFKKLVKSNENIFVFKNYIFEELKPIKNRENFKTLKEAIKNRNYIDLTFIEGIKPLINVMPYKLLFIANNWYIVVILQNLELTLKRVAFINTINIYSKKYNLLDETKYINYLKEIQNSLTLFNKPKRVAKLKATKAIARYFKEDIKKQLTSQNYIKTQEDGSVIFTLEYTQPQEILILLQRWLPDLIILEPQELKDEYIKKLQSAIDNNKI